MPWNQGSGRASKNITIMNNHVFVQKQQILIDFKRWLSKDNKMAPTEQAFYKYQKYHPQKTNVTEYICQIQISS